MTSTAPGAHPPPEEVDALLDPSGGDAQVEAHVAGCPRCQGVRDGLLRVRALLGAQAATTPPEPPDLGARIAAALAAEPPLRPAGQGTGGEGGQVLALPRRRRWPAYLAVAAGVAVVGLGGTFALTRVAGSGSDTAGSAAEAPQDAREDSSGGAAAPGVTSLPPTIGTDPTRGAVDAVGGDVEASGTSYTRVSLASQAQELLLSSTDAGQGVTELQDTLADDGVRAACLVAVGRPGAEPVATDLASFEGVPAAVLVLPSGSGYDVLVVPLGCGNGDDRVLARAQLE